MGLLSKIFNDAADNDFRLAQDLVAMAMADGIISDVEYHTIVDICQSYGISKDVVEAHINGTSERHEAMPASKVDKKNYLKRLIKVMGADGDCSQIEVFLMEVIAGKLGFKRLELVSLVINTTSREHFQGDLGNKAMNSFLKNVIDPKFKTLQQNQDILRKIMKLMADDIRADFPEGDPDSFEVMMNKGVHLLEDNSVLSHEYATMGISLVRTLKEECRRLINNNTRQLLKAK